MEKRVILLLTETALLLLLSAEKSSGNFFSSLQFTRDSLMDFSRGSKKTTKEVIHQNVTDTKKATKKAIHFLGRSGFGGFGRTEGSTPPPTKTVVTCQRSSPSNKFLEAINDIEKAVANAKASGRISYSNATFAKLKTLVERAIKSKSYKYARKVRHRTLSCHYPTDF